MQNKNKHESGQVFLIAVLILVIGLTVGLSVASRSVTNLKTSLEEENSQRAFAAAEAGVEKAIKSGASSGELLFGEANTKIHSVSVAAINGSQIQLRGDTLIEPNDGEDIWLSNHDPASLYSSKWSGKMKLFWGDVDCSVSPVAALEVIVMAADISGNPTSKRYIYEPCSTRNTGVSDIFQSVTFNIQNRTYKYRTGPITVANGYIARVIPLYLGSYIGIEVVQTTGGTFPDQGKIINSTGIAGGTTRKIKYIQGWPKIPNEIFQYVLFQPN